MRVRNYAKFQNKQYLKYFTTYEGKKRVEFLSGAIDTVKVQCNSYQRLVQGYKEKL